MGAHGKETPVDKKLCRIREQTEWKLTLDLIYIFANQVSLGWMPVVANETQHCM